MRRADGYDDVLALELVPAQRPVLDRDATFFGPGDDERVDHHVTLRAR
ncbi:MAG: hypothetical protein IRZ16_07890 [Myxococcaceae bacterium]|nr:hypothetical protein [Myxococcaceae bacterium]